MTKSYRGNAIAVGVLFFACSVASILAAIPLGSALEAADYLSQLTGRDTSVVLTALLEVIWAATGAGIAIGLFPVLRSYGRALALGSVAARVVEGVFVLMGTLALLTLLTVSQDSVTAGAAGEPKVQPVGDALLAVRDWAHGFLALLAFCIGAFLYYVVLYRSRLIPRWLSGWGLVGVPLMAVSTVMAGLAQDFGFTTLNTVLNIPIGLQEMVLAFWLLIKGFNQSALGAAPARSALPSGPSQAHETHPAMRTG